MREALPAFHHLDAAARTSSFGDSPCTVTPSNSIEPLVTSPRSACSRLEIAFSVVVLPAPLAPEQRDDAAARHFERHALQHQDDVVVDDLDIVDRRICSAGGGGNILCDGHRTTLGFALILRDGRFASSG
jgi:hypothetical protein